MCMSYPALSCTCLTRLCHGYHTNPTIDLRARERRYLAGYSTGWDIYAGSRWVGSAWATGELPAYRWHVDGEHRGGASTLALVASSVALVLVPVDVGSTMG